MADEKSKRFWAMLVEDDGGESGHPMAAMAVENTWLFGVLVGMKYSPVM